MLAAFISSEPLPASWRELYVMLATSSAALIAYFLWQRHCILQKLRMKKFFDYERNSRRLF